jgi:hypothetical protein
MQLPIQTPSIVTHTRARKEFGLAGSVRMLCVNILVVGRWLYILVWTSVCHSQIYVKLYWLNQMEIQLDL